ncbi:hypothetical protein E2562_035650 [Oryza meyeriana var. granulata]|uniref:Uncharacterized protein n=1 Tax=Oryza meyeriana var. granulata TaxID=110450 RepID=A0A6G1FFT4_9ORYZ|nr:hypothetical protein E2562_035650 [Oryza meyeriana var. granulata]
MEMSLTKIKDRTDLDLKNIAMTLQGLTEEDRRDLETKLEIEMREYEKKLLACYRKTENGEFRANEVDKHQEAPLPGEFRANEVDKHQEDGAQSLADKENVLECHQMTSQDIVQVKKSPYFSNPSNQII